MLCRQYLTNIRTIETARFSHGTCHAK